MAIVWKVFDISVLIMMDNNVISQLGLSDPGEWISGFRFIKVTRPSLWSLFHRPPRLHVAPKERIFPIMVALDIHFNRFISIKMYKQEGRCPSLLC